MLIKYISCDGGLREEEIISMEFIENSEPELFLCTRPQGGCFEVGAKNVKYVGHSKDLLSKEHEIINAIVNICNENRNAHVTFIADWGGNNLTVIFSRGRHTHCGFPEGEYERLIDDLYDVLMEEQKLPW